ncbi:PucR family transcriptional regulator [Rhodococcus koreensis]|uniref:PucR family transcriptional regulator n=1 Tax=Rhodococcus koreensis TaxID=99653 RepID=UPI00366EF97A
MHWPHPAVAGQLSYGAPGRDISTDADRTSGGSRAARPGTERQTQNMITATTSTLAGHITELRTRVPHLARAAIDRYIEGTVRYAETGIPGYLHRESVHTIQTLLSVCLRSVLEDSLDVPGSLREIIERGTERVAEGLPLREYMRCWQIGFDVLAEELHTTIGAGHPGLRLALTRTRQTYDCILREVISAYELHAMDLLAAQGDDHARVIDALLRGEQWPGEDRGQVPAHPVIALLHLGEIPGENSADPQIRATTAKRKVRLLRAALARTLPGQWLTDLHPRHGRLVMHPPATDLDALAAELEQVSGATVTIAVENATGVDDLPRAAATAAEVLDTALRCGRTGKSSRMTDVALEHHLAHTSSSLPVLLERCRALRDRPELIATLQAYLAHNLDRRSTAHALFVHPNTVDNRLTRVHELTGLDVRITTDLLTLAVATHALNG